MSQVDFTVVGSGPNGANPHHEAGDRGHRGRRHGGPRLRRPEARLRLRHTRTVHVGEPTAEIRQVHDVVGWPRGRLRAVRPGVACQEVDQAARAVITEAGSGSGSSTAPATASASPPTTAVHDRGRGAAPGPGMCFSIEPGIYLPGRFGVRIEDIVTVTATGAVDSTLPGPPRRGLQ